MTRSRSIKGVLTRWTARACRRPPLTPEQLLKLEPSRILVVRQHNQMGDMICATPALRALREAYPAAELALVTAPVNFEVVRHNPHLNRVFPFDRRMWRAPGRLIRFIREIRSYRAELAFVLSSVSFSVTSAAIALLSGARYVVGGQSAPFGWDLSRHAFSLELPSVPELDRHAVQHSLAPLAAVGITTGDQEPVVVPAPAEVEQASRILAELDLKPGFWALHPGAGKAQNVWPALRFAEVVRRAVAAGHQVLILHGPADASALNGLVAGLGELVGAAVRIAPACSIGVGAALLQEADRFLCNDTGVMHLAGALKVPTIALFGPTDPALWKPPAAEVIALVSSSRTPDSRGPEFGWLENISVDEVWLSWSRHGRSQNATHGG